MSLRVTVTGTSALSLASRARARATRATVCEDDDAPFDGFERDLDRARDALSWTNRIRVHHARVVGV
jgi:hypothetical protein